MPPPPELLAGKGIEGLHELGRAGRRVDQASLVRRGERMVVLIDGLDEYSATPSIDQ
jgi:hypothetical protein